MVPEVERTLASFAPAQPVWDLKTMRQALFTMWGLLVFRLAGGFGAFLGVIALMLTLVGLYGVTSSDASRRTREIGVRIALGAARAGIVRMILRDAMVIVLTGLGAGFVASLAASKVVGQFVIVSPLDPLVYVFVSAALTIVVLLACLALRLRRCVSIQSQFYVRNNGPMS